MNQQPKPSAMQRAVAGFANCLAAILAVLLAPTVTNLYHRRLYDYLHSGFDYDVAHWGAWTVIVLALLCVFFGISMALQFLVQLVMRSGANRRSF